MLIGLCLVLYPVVGNFCNSFHTSSAVASYTDSVDSIDKNKYSEIWSQAEEYNHQLSSQSGNFTLTKEAKVKYDDLLNINNTGIMCYIDIPAIDVRLPVYHRTDTNVLQAAAGHLDWTSLPVGGQSTHCVISGHCGLPGAKLFSNLDRMKKGDLFTIHVLDETLTYRVEKIQIIEPTDTEPLMIEEGRDLCTLMTCTPYGVNSHRLLVHGQRINPEKEKVVSDAIQIAPMAVFLTITAFVLIMFLFVWLLIYTKKHLIRKNDTLMRKE